MQCEPCQLCSLFLEEEVTRGPTNVPETWVPLPNTTLRCACVIVSNVTEELRDAQVHRERRRGFMQMEADMFLILNHPLSLTNVTEPPRLWLSLEWLFWGYVRSCGTPSHEPQVAISDSNELKFSNMELSIAQSHEPQFKWSMVTCWLPCWTTQMKNSPILAGSPTGQY